MSQTDEAHRRRSALLRWAMARGPMPPPEPTAPPARRELPAVSGVSQTRVTGQQIVGQDDKTARNELLRWALSTRE